jgi:hypothetical protein
MKYVVFGVPTAVVKKIFIIWYIRLWLNFSGVHGVIYQEIEVFFIKYNRKIRYSVL